MSVGKVVGSSEQYRIEEEVAKGAFSVVYRCTDLRTGRRYAIKVVNKKLAEQQHMTEALIREVNAMEVTSKSPYVIHLVDKLVSKHNYYIVMGLAEGGTLLDVIRARRGSGHYSWIAPLFKQLLAGIADMHGSNVVHRDIKPENILLNKHKTRILISDFGFACYSPENHELHRACGTLRYCAPELLSESPRYDGRKVDVWAAGVTLYVMFCGAHPFPTRAGVDPDTLLHTIASTSVDYPQQVPDAARDIIAKMLCADPKKRWTAKQLLDHPWMRDVPMPPPGDTDDKDAASPMKRMARSNSQAGTTSTQLPPLAGESMSPALARTSDNAEFTAPPNALSLDDIDDGFYFHHSDRSGGEESFEHFDGGSSEYEADVAVNGAFLSVSHEGGRFAYHSSSQAMSSGSRAGVTASAGLSPNSSSLGLPRPRKHEEEVDYDVVFEGLFVRPRMYIRGVCLTIHTVVRFFLFCFALLLATALRVIFDTDISGLPLPQPVLNLFANLLVPQDERDRRHAHAGIQRLQQQEQRRRQQRQAQDGRPPTVAPPTLREGLLGSKRNGVLGENHHGVGSPAPGSKLRRYVRAAEKRISNSSLSYNPSHAHHPRTASSDTKVEQRQRGYNSDDSCGSSSDGEGAISHTRDGLRRRSKGPPQPPPGPTEVLCGPNVQLPKPLSSSTTHAPRTDLTNPTTPPSLASPDFPTHKELSATMPPKHTPHDSTASANGKSSGGNGTSIPTTALPPLYPERQAGEQTSVGVGGGGKARENTVFSPSVPLRSWPSLDDARKLKREDFPTPPAAHGLAASCRENGAAH